VLGIRIATPSDEALASTKAADPMASGLAMGLDVAPTITEAHRAISASARSMC
jgi:hypothetical protein